MSESLYLVGLNSKLIVWNEQSNQQLFEIEDCGSRVSSIKRLGATTNYFIKTSEYVTFLTIEDLNSSQYTLLHLLAFSNKTDITELTDSMQLQITQTHMILAATRIKQDIKSDKYKNRIWMMKFDLPREDQPPSQSPRYHYCSRTNSNQSPIWDRSPPYYGYNDI